jgi:hypothetical protein
MCHLTDDLPKLSNAEKWPNYSECLIKWKWKW